MKSVGFIADMGHLSEGINPNHDRGQAYYGFLVGIEVGSNACGGKSGLAIGLRNRNPLLQRFGFKRPGI